MGRFVIAAYKPKQGSEPQLLDLVARHGGVLRAEGLISDKVAHVMRADDGTLIEVFEWLNEHAAARAHAIPQVQALWAEFAAVCDFPPLASIAEANRPFAHYESVDFETPAMPGESN